MAEEPVIHPLWELGATDLKLTIYSLPSLWFCQVLDWLGESRLTHSLLYFGGLWVWSQCCVLTGQALYHLNSSPSPKAHHLIRFSNRVTACPASVVHATLLPLMSCHHNPKSHCKGGETFGKCDHMLRSWSWLSQNHCGVRPKISAQY
jgi:hypothetical protein